MSNLSIVYDTGYDVSEDGYTKTPDSFHANGLWAINLSCHHYQRLIDRNWRRSGKYLYKPHPEKCLSLQYTIRLDVHKFKPSLSHKNLLKRIQTYLQDGSMPTNIGEEESKKKKKQRNKKDQNLTSAASSNGSAATGQTMIQSIFTEAIDSAIKSLNIANLQSDLKIAQVSLPLQSVGKKRKNQKVGDLFSDVAVRLFGQCKKQQISTPYTTPGALAQSIVEELQKNSEVSKRISNIEPAPNGFINLYLTSEAKNQLTEQLNERKQISEHDNAPVEQRVAKKPKLEAAHRLTISLAPATFTQESYELYKKYQIAVHKDDPEKLSEKGYTDFLVSSPMEIERTGKECNSFELVDDIPELEGLAALTFSGFHGYGTYHVDYRLDGELFMVGVVDLLPKCLSSVYLYYDPDKMFLKPGVYSALAEILYVKLMSKRLPDFHYYYMGYYIHTCQKMIYKAGYKPSDLLCPITYTWVPIHECIDRVKKDNDHKNMKPGDRVLRLAPDSVPAEEVDNDINQIPCIVDKTLVSCGVIRRSLELPDTLINALQVYKKLLGPTLSAEIARIVELEE